jgi:hypothetical protein
MRLVTLINPKQLCLVFGQWSYHSDIQAPLEVKNKKLISVVRFVITHSLCNWEISVKNFTWNRNCHSYEAYILFFFVYFVIYDNVFFDSVDCHCFECPDCYICTVPLIIKLHLDLYIAKLATNRVIISWTRHQLVKYRQQNRPCCLIGISLVVSTVGYNQGTWKIYNASSPITP